MQYAHIAVCGQGADDNGRCWSDVATPGKETMAFKGAIIWLVGAAVVILACARVWIEPRL